MPREAVDENSLHRGTRRDPTSCRRAAPREATVPVVKQEREVGAPLEQAEDRKKFLKSEDGQRSSIPQWVGGMRGRLEVEILPYGGLDIHMAGATQCTDC